MSEKKQKKTFAVVLGLAVLIFVFSFGLASCGGTRGGGGSGGSKRGPGGGKGDGSRDQASLMISLEDYAC